MMHAFTLGFVHPFLGFDHLLSMSAVGLWAWQLGGRARWAVPLAFALAVLAGGALGLAGITHAATETMVAATGVALGLMFASGLRVPMAAIPLVSLFAVFHGAAHALEAPDAGRGAAVLGFFVATALLHGVGLGAGFLLKPGARALRLAGVPLAAAGAFLVVRAIA